MLFQSEQEDLTVNSPLASLFVRQNHLNQSCLPADAPSRGAFSCQYFTA